MNQSYFTIVDLIYRPNGIFVTLENVKTKQICYRYIRIATISNLHPFPLGFKIITSHSNIASRQSGLLEERGRLQTGKISFDQWFRASEYFNWQLPVQLPLEYGKGHSILQNLKYYKQLQFQNHFLNSMKHLLKNGIEIIIRNYNRSYIVVLVDYGPLYTKDSHKSEIANRSSLLDNYVNLKNFYEFIKVSQNGLIYFDEEKIQPNSIHQLFDLSENLLASFIDEYKPSIPDNHNIGLIDNTFLTDSKANLAFLLKNSDGYTNMQFLRYGLKNGQMLVIDLDNNNFEEWLNSFVHNSNNSNEYYFYIGREPPLGFHTVDLNKLSLHYFDYDIPIQDDYVYEELKEQDLINNLQNKYWDNEYSNRGQKNEMIQEINDLFMILDTVFNQRKYTLGGLFDRFINEIDEYDPNILTQFTSYENIIKFLENQLANQDIMGNFSHLMDIFLLFKKFYIGNILNTDYLKLNKMVGVPRFLHFSSHSLDSDNLIALLFFILYQILNKQLMTINPKNLTIIVDDSNVFKKLQKLELFRLMNDIYLKEGIRVVIKKPNNIRIDGNSPFKTVSILTDNRFDRTSFNDLYFIKIGNSFSHQIHLESIDVTEKISILESSKNINHPIIMDPNRKSGVFRNRRKLITQNNKIPEIYPEITVNKIRKMKNKSNNKAYAKGGD